MASSTFWRNARCLATGAGIGVFGTQVVSQAAGKNPLFDSHTVPGLGRRLPGREERAKKGPTVLPVIRMAGTIEAPRPGQVSSQSISLQKYEDVFIQAFRLKPPAVVIEMNSPGGSPAQSSLIHARLLELRKQVRARRPRCLLRDFAPHRRFLPRRSIRM
jgi:ClpP class serine protease